MAEEYLDLSDEAGEVESSGAETEEVIEEFGFDSGIDFNHSGLDKALSFPTAQDFQDALGL